MAGSTLCIAAMPCRDQQQQRAGHHRKRRNVDTQLNPQLRLSAAKKSISNDQNVPIV